MTQTLNAAETMTDYKAELRCDIDELQMFLQQACRIQVQDMLCRDIDELESLSRDYIEQEHNANDSDFSENDNPPVRRFSIKLRTFGWDQTNKYIKIFVVLNNVHTLPKARVHCKLTERSVCLRVKDLDNTDYILNINNLLEPIDIEMSQRKLKHDMVVIYLAKARRNFEWSHITEPDKDIDEQHRTDPESSSSDEGNDEAGAGGAGDHLEMERNNDRAIEANGPKQNM